MTSSALNSHRRAGNTTQEVTQVPAGFHCPPWCHDGRDGHQQAIDEGCPWEDARLHRSVDLAGVAPRLSNAFDSSHVQRELVAYWHLVALADPGGNGRAWGLPMIEVEVSTHDETTRTGRAVANITSSEARTLAAQLVRLADLLDLEHLA